MFILNDSNSIFPSSIESRGVEKYSVCISFSEPINPRSDFPEFSFQPENFPILISQRIFKVMKEKARGIVGALLYFS